MTRCLAAAVLTVLLVASCGCVAAQEPIPMVTAHPQEIDDVLANPGMGWQTFHRFADEDPNLHGIPTAAAYFRFYWKELEPEEGRIDFATLDDLLAHAHRAGQKLGFRVMLASTDGGGSGSPEWLRQKGVHGWEYQYGHQGRYWVPDLEDPLVKEAHTRLLRELGQRYDGHPDLDYVDIGSVGLWGEWHFSDTQVIPGGEPVPMPSQARRLEIIDEYRKYFPKTPKLMLIGDAEGMRDATHSGCGWRADCLGDMGGFSRSWNHMDNAYRQQIAESDAGAAWRQAPVAWESCWTMRKWVEEGWDISYIFDYGLEFHASYLNNKSAGIETKWRPEIDRFLRKLGYRLVLRSLQHPASGAPGASLRVTMGWENVGVAPPYRDYLLAFRLSGPSGVRVVATDTSIKGWMPGPKAVSTTLSLPSDVAPGRYDVAIGVVEPGTHAPAIKLAIAGRDGEGWYPVSQCEVRR